MDLNIILILRAIIVAIVEGITEFLPVSSTGHMIIVGNMINFKGEFENLFEIVIQLGAILAIVVLYWNKIWLSVKEFFTGKKRGIKFWMNIIIAVIPAGIVGVLFEDKIDKLLFKPLPVAVALIVGAVMMILIENRFRDNYNTPTVDDISLVQAIKIGCFQCMALWPGMSRSASTIMGGWITGLSTVAAAEFSFFLAIPTMIGASGYKLMTTGLSLNSGEIITLVVGFIVSFLVALVVVDKFIGFLKKKPMRGFAVYRLFVGVIIIFFVFNGII
jgi:undecaprenyl-diphosphatase